MILKGTAEELERELVNMLPAVVEAEQKAAALARGSAKQRVRKYQAYALYVLASVFDDRAANALEIGTYYGYTAAIIAQAMPGSRIVTLNILPWEVEAARKNLKEYAHVKTYYASSWDRLKDYQGPQLDFLFVDGDHKNIDRDLPWFNWLREGGLLICHDYSPEGAGVACPPVYRGLNRMRDKLRREFDVLIVDSDQIGIAGFYRRTGEIL